MKRLIFFIPLLALSCRDNYSGTYSECWGDNTDQDGCHFIILNPDSTFLYSDPFSIGSNIETTGNWRVKHDTLVLNNDIPEFTFGTSATANTSDNLAIRIQTKSDNEIMDCYSAIVVINQNDSLVTNEMGVVTFEKGLLDSISIKYVGCFNTWISLSDSIKAYDTLQIFCNHDAIFQVKMKNMKWKVKNDTIFIDYGNDVFQKLVKRKG